MLETYSKNRTSRKRLKGVVTTLLGNKSVKVTYNYKIPHHLYGKAIKRKTVIYAHDEYNRCVVGDKVCVMQTRPLSRLKRWIITKIL